MKKGLKIGLILLFGLGLASCGKIAEKMVAPSNGTDQDDPRAIAAALREKTITNDEVVTLFQRPPEFHLSVARQLFLLDGKSATEADSLVEGFREELRPLDGTTRTAAMASATGSCDQWIEHKTVVRDPSWAIYTTSYRSSRGTEYVYYFSPGWTVDPDNIRWGASDPRVFWALYLRDGGKLWGSHLCGKPYQLLVGDNTVAAAGGQYWVMANLYVHHL